VKWAVIVLAVVVLALAAGTFALSARGSGNGRCDGVPGLSAVCGSNNEPDNQAGDGNSSDDGQDGDNEAGDGGDSGD
jgi:hypothetical protein